MPVVGPDSGHRTCLSALYAQNAFEAPMSLQGVWRISRVTYTDPSAPAATVCQDRSSSCAVGLTASSEQDGT